MNRRTHLRSRAVLLLTAALVLAAPATAHGARVWLEGTADQPLSVGAADNVTVGSVRSAPGATLERQLLWEYRRPGTAPFEPFSVAALDSGNVLIASRTNEVLEVSRRNRIVWSYTRLDDDPDLVNTYSAQRLGNGNTLITDRRADFVIEVTPDKQIVWRYGAQRDSLAPGSLVDPFTAKRLPNGNTLITDNRGATRVIEVRSSDYDPNAPNLGYTENSIVWQYGHNDEGGVGPGQLASPRYAERLSNGNTLITDAADQVFAGHRVIEVTPGGQIVWQFGVAGVAGTDDTHLFNPSCAQRPANGNTVILEEDGQRLLEVDPSGEIVDLYSKTEYNPPGATLDNGRSMDRTSSGTTLIANQGAERVIEIGYALEGSLTSDELSLGLPGVKKVISKIEFASEIPEGTSVSLAYSLDGGAWVSGDGSAITLPSGSTARQIRYRATLGTESRAYAPVLRQVRITYDVAPSDPGTPGGGTDDGNGNGDGNGDGNGSGSGSGNGSGSNSNETGNGSGETGSGTTKKTTTTTGGIVRVPGPGILPGTGAGGVGRVGASQARYARGTLLGVVSSAGRDGVGLGGLGGSPDGIDGIALGLGIVMLSYAAGAFGSAAVNAAHTATSGVLRMIGRSTG